MRSPAHSLLLGTVGPAAAQTRPWAGNSIVHDPEWQERFLGSYGFLSGAEPRISDAELLLLRDVLELMKTDQAAAAVMLQQQVTASSSASLDFMLANLEFQAQNLDAAAAHYERAIEEVPGLPSGPQEPGPPPRDSRVTSNRASST